MKRLKKIGAQQTSNECRYRNKCQIKKDKYTKQKNNNVMKSILCMIGKEYAIYKELKTN